MSYAPVLHHLALGADNVESLAAFYRDRIGLPEVERHLYDHGGLRSIWLRLSEGSVLMVEPAMQGRREVPHHSSGLFLLAFSMPVERRIKLEEELQVDDRTGHTSYFRDPEGNRFAISDYPL